MARRSPEDFTTRFELRPGTDSLTTELLLEALQDSDESMQEFALLHICGAMLPIFAEPTANWLMRHPNSDKNFQLLVMRGLLNLPDCNEKRSAITILLAHPSVTVQLALAQAARRIDGGARQLNNLED